MNEQDLHLHSNFQQKLFPLLQFQLYSYSTGYRRAFVNIKMFVLLGRETVEMQAAARGLIFGAPGQSPNEQMFRSRFAPDHLDERSFWNTDLSTQADVREIVAAHGSVSRATTYAQYLGGFLNGKEVGGIF